MLLEENMIDFHRWAKYASKETQAHRQPTHIDLAAFKICDVYTAFCYAKLNFDCFEYICKIKEVCDKTKLFFQVSFLQNSIFYFNSCIDYFWQVLYAYCQKDEKKLYEHYEHEKISEQESLSTEVDKLIAYGIELGEDLDVVSNIKKEIDALIMQTQIRQIFNYLKHRGQYAIHGLGDNSKKSFEKQDIKVMFQPANSNIVYNCPPLKLLYREELDLDTTHKNVFTFMNEFSVKFDKLIKIIIPNEYLCEKRAGIDSILSSFDLSIIDNLINNI